MRSKRVAQPEATMPQVDLLDPLVLDQGIQIHAADAIAADEKVVDHDGAAAADGGGHFITQPHFHDGSAEAAHHPGIIKKGFMLCINSQGQTGQC